VAPVGILYELHSQEKFGEKLFPAVSDFLVNCTYNLAIAGIKAETPGVTACGCFCS
jgi:hypothetical protein